MAPSLRKLADLHGYDVLVEDAAVHADGRPPAWAKVRLLRSLIDRFDVVLWVDADAMVVAFDVDPIAEMRPDTFQGIVGQPKFHGAPNTGVWLVQADDRARSFLDAVWAKTEHTDSPMWEQAAVYDLLGFRVPTGEDVGSTSWREQTTWLAREWNEVSQLDDGRIRHYASRSHEERVRRMRIDQAAVKDQRARHLYLTAQFAARRHALRLVTHLGPRRRVRAMLRR